MEQQESSPLATTTLEDTQRDLTVLRDDVSRLSQEVATYGRQAVHDVNEQQNSLDRA